MEKIKVSVFIVGILLYSTVLFSSEVPVSLQAISFIESSHNASAIGDGGKALGLYQLHSGVIKDFNRKHKTRYTHQDALDKTISERITNWYLHSELPRLLRHFKKEVSLENVLSAWNMGIGKVVKGKKAVRYIEKYRRAYATLRSDKGGVEDIQRKQCDLERPSGKTNRKRGA